MRFFAVALLLMLAAPLLLAAASGSLPSLKELAGQNIYPVQDQSWICTAKNESVSPALANSSISFLTSLQLPLSVGQSHTDRFALRAGPSGASEPVSCTSGQPYQLNLSFSYYHLATSDGSKNESNPAYPLSGICNSNLPTAGQSASDSYWQSASPIAITNHSLAGDGTLRLTLQNQGSEALVVLSANGSGQLRPLAPKFNSSLMNCTTPSIRLYLAPSQVNLAPLSEADSPLLVSSDGYFFYLRSPQQEGGLLAFKPLGSNTMLETDYADPINFTLDLLWLSRAGVVKNLSDTQILGMGRRLYNYLNYPDFASYPDGAVMDEQGYILAYRTRTFLSTDPSWPELGRVAAMNKLPGVLVPLPVYPAVSAAAPNSSNPAPNPSNNAPTPGHPSSQSFNPNGSSSTPSTTSPPSSPSSTSPPSSTSLPSVPPSIYPPRPSTPSATSPPSSPSPSSPTSNPSTPSSTAKSGAVVPAGAVGIQNPYSAQNANIEADANAASSSPSGWPTWLTPILAILGVIALAVMAFYFRPQAVMMPPAAPMPPESIYISDSRLELLQALEPVERIPTDLSTMLGKSKSTVVEHLDALCQAGLVERIETPGKKFVFYRLSHAGRDLMLRRKNEAQ